MAIRRKRLGAFSGNTGSGRETKCTPALIELMEQYVKEGLPIVRVCDLVGVHDEQFRRWLENGKNYLKASPAYLRELNDQALKNHAFHAEFYLMTLRANSNWQLEVIRRDLNGGEGGDWRRGISLLSRRDHEHWAEKKNVQDSPTTTTWAPDPSFL